MSTRQSYSTVKTKLISSYAWDTAIDFIQKNNSDNEHSDYATNQSYAAAFYPYINCGGNFGDPSNHFSAGNRNRYSDGSIGNEWSGFRIALYVN